MNNLLTSIRNLITDCQETKKNLDFESEEYKIISAKEQALQQILDSHKERIKMAAVFCSRLYSNKALLTYENGFRDGFNYAIGK